MVELRTIMKIDPRSAILVISALKKYAKAVHACNEAANGVDSEEEMMRIRGALVLAEEELIDVIIEEAWEL